MYHHALALQLRDNEYTFRVCNIKCYVVMITIVMNIISYNFFSYHFHHERTLFLILEFYKEEKIFFADFQIRLRIIIVIEYLFAYSSKIYHKSYMYEYFKISKLIIM